MKYDKIICLYYNENEKEFVKGSHSIVKCNIPLEFVSTLDELKQFISEKTFIILSVKYADLYISDIKQLFIEYPNLIFNFHYYDTHNALPLNVLDLLFDYSKHITKPESSIFLMEQLVND